MMKNISIFFVNFRVPSTRYFFDIFSFIRHFKQNEKTEDFPKTGFFRQ